MIRPRFLVPIVPYETERDAEGGVTWMSHVFLSWVQVSAMGGGALLPRLCFTMFRFFLLRLDSLFISGDRALHTSTRLFLRLWSSVGAARSFSLGSHRLSILTGAPLVPICW